MTDLNAAAGVRRGRVSNSTAAEVIGTQNGFFTVALFIGLHTAISVVSGTTLIAPYILAFAAAMGLFWTNKARINKAFVDWFIQLTGLFALMAILVSVRDGNYFVHLRASAQLVYSMVIGCAVYLGLTGMGRERVAGAFFWISCIIIIGCLLEIAGPLRPISDGFRDIFNSWYGAYDADLRDTMRYGGYRPKFFASEPSILGLTAGISIALFFAAKRWTNGVGIGLGALSVCVAFYIIRSPNILFGPAALGLIFLAQARGMTALQKFFARLAFLIYAAFILLAPLLSLYAMFVLRDGPSYITTDLSYFERIVAPFLMAGDALRASPVFGIGLGDKVQIQELAIRTFHDMNVLHFLTIRSVAMLGLLVSNSFWEYWIFLGAGGGLALAWMLVRLFRLLRLKGSGTLALAICGITFWQGLGGVNTPIMWSMLFIVASMFMLMAPDRPLAVGDAKASPRFLPLHGVLHLVTLAGGQSVGMLASGSTPPHPGQSMDMPSPDPSDLVAGEYAPARTAGYSDILMKLWFHLRHSYLSLIAIIIIFAGLGVVIVSNEKPEYTAVSILGPAPSPLSDIASMSGGMGGVLGSGITRQLGLGGSANGSNLFDQYTKLLQSYEIAAKLSQDPNVLRAIFPERYDWEAQRWKTPEGLLVDFKSWVKQLIHYPDRPVPGVEDVAQYLAHKLTVDAPLTTNFVTVSLASDSPQKAEWLLNALLSEADDIVRETRRHDVDSRIVYLTRALPTVTQSGQKEALSTILSDQQQSMMIIHADKRYASALVDAPHASPVPSAPSVLRTVGLMVLLAIACWVALVGLGVGAGRRARARNLR